MNVIASYFTSPNFPDDPDKTRVAQLLHKVFIIGIVICLGCIPLLAPVVPTFQKMVLINTAVTCCCFVLIRMNKRGHVRAAGVGVLLILLIAVFVDSLSPEQPISPAIVALFLSMTYAGFAFGVRGLIASATLNSLMLIVLLQIHLGRHPALPEQQNLFYQYTLQILFMWIACSAFTITVRYLQQTQHSLREREADLAQRNQRLEQEVQERRQITSELAERTHELGKLLEVTQTIGLRLDLQSLHAVLFEKLKEVVHYDGVLISEFVDQYNLRVLSCAGDINTSLIGQVALTDIEQDDYLRDLINNRKPIIVPDIYVDTAYARAFHQRLKRNNQTITSHIRCIMVVPLVMRDKLIGAMRLMNSQVNGYDAHDATLALAFASQAAMLIESTRAHQEDLKAAAMKERTRIARELHDSVSQALFGIVLGVRTSLHHHQSQEDPSAALNYALTLSEAALAEIRALIFELRPEYLEKEGLLAAFRKQAESLMMRHQLEVHMCLTDDEPPLSLAAKEAVYRIGLEALQNTLKHAQATRIDLKMMTEQQTLVLEVSDNGKGFDPTQVFQGHFGLSTMRERAEQFGATVQIESQVGCGTQLHVRMPIR